MKTTLKENKVQTIACDFPKSTVIIPAQSAEFVTAANINRLNQLIRHLPIRQELKDRLERKVALATKYALDGDYGAPNNLNKPLPENVTSISIANRGFYLMTPCRIVGDEELIVLPVLETKDGYVSLTNKPILCGKTKENFYVVEVHRERLAFCFSNINFDCINQFF